MNYRVYRLFCFLNFLVNGLIYTFVRNFSFFFNIGPFFLFSFLSLYFTSLIFIFIRYFLFPLARASIPA